MIPKRWQYVALVLDYVLVSRGAVVVAVVIANEREEEVDSENEPKSAGVSVLHASDPVDGCRYSHTPQVESEIEHEDEKQVSSNSSDL
jgi:hypothetical protein